MNTKQALSIGAQTIDPDITEAEIDALYKEFQALFSYRAKKPVSKTWARDKTPRTIVMVRDSRYSPLGIIRYSN